MWDEGPRGIECRTGLIPSPWRTRRCGTCWISEDKEIGVGGVWTTAISGLYVSVSEASG
jgi:hypothetical protein